MTSTGLASAVACDVLVTSGEVQQGRREVQVRVRPPPDWLLFENVSTARLTIHLRQAAGQKWTRVVDQVPLMSSCYAEEEEGNKWHFLDSTTWVGRGEGEEQGGVEWHLRLTLLQPSPPTNTALRQFGITNIKA
eukprot:GHVS01079472.1.p2 GENE.GHVS01079472.1~~GHVS01079472.1.p2  ORF type:complete len:134 (-),score=28.49 GHVS01079472.1:217-618(-)